MNDICIPPSELGPRRKGDVYRKLDLAYEEIAELKKEVKKYKDHNEFLYQKKLKAELELKALSKKYLTLKAKKEGGDTSISSSTASSSTAEYVVYPATGDGTTIGVSKPYRVTRTYRVTGS